jgi:hypothetical protein
MSLKRVLGLSAVAGLLILAAPTDRAAAASLINPGIAAAVQDGSLSTTTEVRWHRGWRRHHGWHRGWHHRRHWRRW